MYLDGIDCGFGNTRIFGKAGYDSHVYVTLGWKKLWNVYLALVVCLSTVLELTKRVCSLIVS